MKRVAYSVLVAASLASSSAFAADMAVKAPPVVATPPWDVVVTAALMNDYNFRGITQSDHKPSTQGGFELRYNPNANLQFYGGLSGESIDFPNNAAAEIDLYGGVRPTLGKLALDFGFWEYYYPGGNCYSPAGNCDSHFSGSYVPPTQLTLATFGPNFLGNVTKSDDSFWEIYAKGTYTINDQWSVGDQEYYSPNVVNTGAWGWYSQGNVTFTAPSTWFTGAPLSGLGGYVSGDLGYWDLGTSDAFYGSTKYTSYTYWDVGFGYTWKVLTLDLRYYDDSLNKSQCDAFTSAQNAGFSPGAVTVQNPSGGSTNWCGAAFIAKLSASLDFNSNLK